MLMLGKVVDNNCYESGESDDGQDDQYQGSFQCVTTQSTLLSGLGTGVLRYKYIGQPGARSEEDKTSLPLFCSSRYKSSNKTPDRTNSQDHCSPVEHCIIRFPLGATITITHLISLIPAVTHYTTDLPSALPNWADCPVIQMT